MTGSPKNYTPIYCIALLTWMSAAAYGQSPGNTPPQKEQSAAPTQSTNKESQTGMPVLPREGMFVVEGKHVAPLEQVGSQVKTDKKQFLKQELSPIPIVPSKRNVEIPGPKAKTRVTNAQVEFYLREAPPDPDRTTPIAKSSRPGESGPEVELVRATVKGNKRQLESIKNLFGQQVEENRKTISMERWEIAPTVSRFTVSEPLPPGEYALAEILPDGMNLYVWDFGMDSTTGPKPATRTKKPN